MVVALKLGELIFCCSLGFTDEVGEPNVRLFVEAAVLVTAAEIPKAAEVAKDKGTEGLETVELAEDPKDIGAEKLNDEFVEANGKALLLFGVAVAPLLLVDILDKGFESKLIAGKESDGLSPFSVDFEVSSLALLLVSSEFGIAKVTCLSCFTLFLGDNIDITSLLPASTASAFASDSFLRPESVTVGNGIRFGSVSLQAASNTSSLLCLIISNGSSRNIGFGGFDTGHTNGNVEFISSISSMVFSSFGLCFLREFRIINCISDNFSVVCSSV